MQFLFESVIIVGNSPATWYRVLEVDTGVYFANPTNKWPATEYNHPPEFFLSKLNGKWVGADSMKAGAYVNPDFVTQVGEAIDYYLFNEKYPSKWQN